MSTSATSALGARCGGSLQLSEIRHIEVAVMECLANYASDDENESGTLSRKESKQPNPGMEGDNYDDVQMDMSEKPLNGRKAPSVQAGSKDQTDGASPILATTQLDSNSSSGPHGKDEGRSSSQDSQNDLRRSASSPSSAASSHHDSEDDNKSNECSTSLPEKEILSNSSKDKDKHTVIKGHPRHRDGGDMREETRDRVRRDARYGSRIRDHKDRTKTSERSERRRSRERDDRRRSRERDRRSHSRSRDMKHKDADRKYRDSSSRGRDYDRKRHRSRSVEKPRTGNDSRSSSSSNGSRSEARPRDSRVQPIVTKKRSTSRSRSRSLEKEKDRPRAADPRKSAYDNKINMKMNVLERMGIELKPDGSRGAVTPQMLVQRTMEQQAAQVKQVTGVELPSYYNAAAINPHRLVDQIQKRKLLWGSRKSEESSTSNTAAQTTTTNKWQGATFAQDQDGKVAAKFNRLMGIKRPTECNPTAETSSAETPSQGSEIIKKQQEMFHNMESQYEVARLATHTHRGLGLGFGTFQPR